MLNNEEVMDKTVFKKLSEIVPEGFISNAIEDLITYSSDQMSPFMGTHVPEWVIRPGTVEEIQRILRLANEMNIAVYPYSFGTNVAGSALPFKKGIVIDLRRFNRILEVNADCMAAVIEPGVSWGMLNKEAREKGLRPTFPQGPYSGGPVGNFLNGPVSPFATRYGPDRVLSLEVVLPNGEILRTGSSGFPSHEILNPYFRYAYGPDLTGLFRGSMGALGIVTKAAYQLFPVGEKEKILAAGFGELDQALGAMLKIERLDISKSAAISTREMLAKCCIPDVAIFQDKDRYERISSSFPEWYLAIGLSCSQRQFNLYERMINEVVRNYGGYLLLMEAEYQANFDDFMLGGGLKINRMFTPEGAIGWIIAIVPPRLILDIRRMTLKRIADLDIRHPQTGALLKPTVWCFPYDRGRSLYFEQDLSYDPLDEDAKVKVKTAFTSLNHEIQKMGGSALVVVPSISKNLLPTYQSVLRVVKKIVDPKGIMSPGTFN